MNKRIFLHLVTLFLFSLLLIHEPVEAAEGMKIRFDVERYKLPNGMTVILHEDHSTPLISYHTWFRVGSKDEEPGYTGIAHLFEHMMFKGAKRYSNKDFDQVLRANGGTNNAFTTRDYTGYYIDLPSSKLELAIDMESDRMEHLQLSEDNLKSERDVVKEERRFRVDNSVRGLMYQSIFTTAYRVHPYRWPVIGWMKDLNNINLKKCEEFFKTYYAPNNAIVVLAGDFNSKKAKKLIEKYYGHIPAQEIPRRKLAVEPEQKGQRQRTLYKQIQNEHLSVSFHISKAGDDDSYALDLLSEILTGGDSSRMHKRLVYSSQIASSVNGYAYTPSYPGLMQFFVSLKPRADTNKALKILYGELWKARNKLYSEKEIQKAKNSVLMSYVGGLKTIHGKASSLALNETVLGSYEYLFKDIDRYLEITPERVKEVAKKYLNPWQRTVVLVKPKKAGQ